MHRMPSAVVEMAIATSRAPDPDPEVPAKVQRRRFTAEYRRRIVTQADTCQAGELGALLRREGLYASHLRTWRRQREQGELAAGRGRKRGPVPKLIDPRVKQPGPLRVVQQCASSQRPQLSHAGRRALRPRGRDPRGPSPHTPGRLRRASRALRERSAPHGNPPIGGFYQSAVASDPSGCPTNDDRHPGRPTARPVWPPARDSWRPIDPSDQRLGVATLNAELWLVESRRSAAAYRTGGASCARRLSWPRSPSGPSLRFSSPLIEPDVRVSRIRLSDEFHVKACAGARE